MPGSFIEFFTSLLKYGLVGMLTMATQTAVFLLLAQVFRFSGLISYTAAVIVSLFVSYFGQSRWTFADRNSHSVWKYLAVVLVAFCVGSSSTWLIVDWAHLSPYSALPVMVIFVPFGSFMMLRWWAFR